MYWILLIMALLVSLVFAIIVGGLATPRKHVAQRYIDLKSSPDAVWQMIRNVGAYPDWREEVRSVTIDASDATATRWTELSDDGSVSYVAAVDEPLSRFAARITDDDLSYSGEWQYVLTPHNGGTRVTISEHGEVGNPIFRFFGTHFFGFTKGIDRYLFDLAIQLGETVKPQAMVP